MEKFKSAIASFFEGDSVPLRLFPLLGLSISFAVLLSWIYLFDGFSLSGIEVEKLWISTDRHSIRFDVSRQMRFLEERLFFQNLQNQDMTTTEGFASVRESVTSRDAEVTAQRLDFQYVVLFFSIFFYD